MSSLVTLDEAKNWLQITKADYDDLINVIIPKASQLVESFTKRAFISSAYQEIIDGSGDYQVELKFYPTTAITAISFSMDKSTKKYSDKLDEGEIINAVSEDGIIETFDTPFTKGRKNVFVAYSAGYGTVDNVPEDIKQVVLDLIYKKYKDIVNQRVGLSVKNVMSENVSYIYEDLNRESRKVLRRYEKIDHNSSGVVVSGWTEE